MPSRTLQLLTWSFLSLSIFGCGTFYNFVHSPCSHAPREIYGGVRMLIKPLKYRAEPCDIAILCLELPLSFAADTATLPITIPIAISRRLEEDYTERDLTGWDDTEKDYLEKDYVSGDANSESYEAARSWNWRLPAGPDAKTSPSSSSRSTGRIAE